MKVSEVGMIILNRAEGPSEEVDRPVVVRRPMAPEKANRILRNWAESAPDSGEGYDKVDVIICKAGGSCERHRADIQRDGTDTDVYEFLQDG